MTDRGPRADMSDQELESLISALPQRDPNPALQGRILSHARRRDPRRRVVLRPAFGLAALVLLLAVDMLVVRWQDASIHAMTGGMPVAIIAEAQPQMNEYFEWLAQVGGSSVSHSVALRPAARPAPETYFSLRSRLLEDADGG